MRRPGTLAGDLSVYSGQQLLGFVRSSTAGITAFRPDGTVLGTFSSRKATTSALGDPGGKS